MKSEELFNLAVHLQSEGSLLGKRFVSILKDKTIRAVEEMSSKAQCGIDVISAAYPLVQNEPGVDKKLYQVYGRCASRYCNSYQPAVGYVGMSGDYYCDGTCAWDADDHWYTCQNDQCNNKYDPQDGIHIDDTCFCSTHCFWDDIVRVGLWGAVQDFFTDHPELDRNRMWELEGKVDPYDFIERRTADYLNELYGFDQDE